MTLNILTVVWEQVPRFFINDMVSLYVSSEIVLYFYADDILPYWSLLTATFLQCKPCPNV